MIFRENLGKSASVAGCMKYENVVVVVLCVCVGGGGGGGGGWGGGGGGGGWGGMSELTGFGKLWYLWKNLGHAPA